MVGHLLNFTYGCDIGKNYLLHGASICQRVSPCQFLISDKLSFYLFQLCLFNEDTVPAYETISGTKPQCMLCFFRAHVQFCRFDKADATADVR